jgi:hypothetical protein
MKKILLFYIVLLLISELLIQATTKPSIKLVKWGPKSTPKSENFNSPNNNSSALWIITNKPIDSGSYLLWGNKTIEITTSKADPLITANIEKENYSKRGVYFLQVISPETKEHSKKIPFIVY